MAITFAVNQLTYDQLPVFVVCQSKPAIQRQNQGLAGENRKIAYAIAHHYYTAPGDNSLQLPVRTGSLCPCPS
jgi:hypothetical protein